MIQTLLFSSETQEADERLEDEPLVTNPVNGRAWAWRRILRPDLLIRAPGDAKDGAGCK